MKRPEQAGQIAVCRHLHSLEQVYKSFTYYAVPNGGFRRPVEAAILKAMGVRAGVPDLVLLGPNGQSCYVEFKADKGRLTESQEMFHAKLKALGFDVIVVTFDCNIQMSLDIILGVLKGWGCLPTGY